MLPCQPARINEGSRKGLGFWSRTGNFLAAPAQEYGLEVQLAAARRLHKEANKLGKAVNACLGDRGTDDEWRAMLAKRLDKGHNALK